MGVKIECEVVNTLSDTTHDMKDYDSDDLIGELEPGKVSVYDEENTRNVINNVLYDNYDNLRKITTDNDFHPRSPVIGKPMHVYRGRVLHGVYVLEYDKSGVKYSRTVMMNMGNVVRTYKYPLIDRAFNSPMVNWENVHLCGRRSWRYTGDLRKYNDMTDNDIIVERVLGGLKLAGTVYVSLEVVEKIKERVASAGFFANRKPHPDSAGTYELLIANPKPFEELFDLDALEADYVNYFKAIDAADVTPDFSSLRGKSMADLMDMNISACRPICMHIVGLILGHPVESIVSNFVRLM